MDALLPIFCLLVGVALPLGIGFVLAKRVHQQTAAPAAYREVARRLGLDVDTRGASVNGYLADERRKLYIGEVMVGHGPDRTTQHRAVLALDRPLGLGVAVRKRTGRSWFRRERGHTIQTGQAEFDKLFKISGDDDDRVRALLTDDVRARVEALASKHPNVLVSDHHVRLLLTQPITQPDALFALITELRQMADALATARRSVTPPARLDGLHTALADLASARDLTFEPGWPAVSGELDGHAVELTIRREDEGYRAMVTGWYRTPYDMGFRLRRQTEPDGYWSVGQDIQVADPAFDAAFVIKGFSPIAVRQFLTETARHRLLQLADLGELTADDHTLRLSRLALDPATLRDAVDRMAKTLSALDATE